MLVSGLRLLSPLPIHRQRQSRRTKKVFRSAFVLCLDLPLLQSLLVPIYVLSTRGRRRGYSENV